MTRTLLQFIVPTTAFGPSSRSLVKCVARMVRRHLARAGRATDREHNDFLIKQDLAHLDRNQLRDIGLDRDAL